MNTQQLTPNHSEATIEPIPSNLESSTAKLVYLYLWGSESATIDELHAALDVEKLTLYPILNTLITANLVTRSENSYHYQSHSKSETKA